MSVVSSYLKVVLCLYRITIVPDIKHIKQILSLKIRCQFLSNPLSLFPYSQVTKRAPIVRAGQSVTLANDDTLIIGIVGGVIGFIVILIIIICIVRLRMINNNSVVTSQHCMNPGCPCPKYLGSPYMTPMAPSSYYMSSMPYEKEMTLR